MSGAIPADLWDIFLLIHPEILEKVSEKISRESLERNFGEISSGISKYLNISGEIEKNMKPFRQVYLQELL